MTYKDERKMWQKIHRAQRLADAAIVIAVCAALSWTWAFLVGWGR